MKMTGAQAIIKVLQEQGVDTVFGYPGGAVIPLYNALYDAPLKNILTAHEQGAIHAADGYARSTGKTGVVICQNLRNFFAVKKYSRNPPGGFGLGHFQNQGISGGGGGTGKDLV